MPTHPRVLGEDWLPVAELGTESQRERTISVAIPPLSRIHVWWARRPLAASAGVVLAGILPSWSLEVQAFLQAELAALSDLARRSVLRPRPSLLPPHAYEGPTEQWYRDWLLHLTGTWGDPVTARVAYDLAVASGERIPNPYNYKQAYKNHVDRVNVDLLHALLKHTWGGELPVILDSTAGGGSIPFTASRLGLPTVANDLNGVAAAILDASVRIPSIYGCELTSDAKRWGVTLTDRVAERMRPYFPALEGEAVEFYLYANAVACPRTGLPIPLSPDWWLRKKKGGIAVRMTVRRNGQLLASPQFDITRGDAIDFDPGRGTVSRGDAISPYDDMVIDGDYIKAEAQAGRMFPIMYAVVVKRSDGKRDFRAPVQSDLDAMQAASRDLAAVRDEWERQNLLPTESIPEGLKTAEPIRYGITTWADAFTDRQLLVHGTFSQEFRRIAEEVRLAMPEDKANAVLVQLALLQGKAVNWNSRLSSWNVNQQSARSVFDRHDLAFKWTFTEYEGANRLYPWTLHVLDNCDANASLIAKTAADPQTGARLARSVTVYQGNAANMPNVPSGSIAHLCVDPPYYDNVMYAELADFFYVWEKRTIGTIRPEFFPGELTDKENEAVANASRFAHLGKRMRPLADADYEAKMTAIFTEARRVLRDDGVLTVMFTHKRAEAWDTLGMGLLKAGFTIESSWPVNTEAEHSLHQSGVNSAASTIMLLCRKRGSVDDAQAVDNYLEDIAGEVRAAARDAVARFRTDGIDGVDLLLSAYGPTLSVVSRHWPVYSSEADEHGRARLLRPEEALTLARSEIVRIQRARLVGHPVDFDPLTDFVVAFWDVIKDDTATFDEGRRLALAVGGLDIDALQRAKVLEKKAGTVRLLAPRERLRVTASDEGSPGVRAQAVAFTNLIDAAHTVCYVADEDGLGSAKVLMERAGLAKDARFLSVVQALVNAVPRVRAKGEFILPLAASLDRLVTAYFPAITLPADPAETLQTEQGDLFADPAT